MDVFRSIRVLFYECSKKRKQYQAPPWFKMATVEPGCFLEGKFAGRTFSRGDIRSEPRLIDEGHNHVLLVVAEFFSEEVKAA